MTQVCPKRPGILRRRLHEWMHERVSFEQMPGSAAHTQVPTIRSLHVRCRWCNALRRIVTVVEGWQPTTSSDSTGEAVV